LVGSRAVRDLRVATDPIPGCGEAVTPLS